MFDFSDNVPARIAHKEVLNDNLTPLSALLALEAKVLLESAYNETGKDRYSILIINEAFRIYKEGAQHWFMCNGVKTPAKEAFAGYVDNAEIMRSCRVKEGGHGFLETLALVRTLAPDPYSAQSHAKGSAPLPPNIPLPLGGAGYLGYEFFSEIERVSFSNPPLYHAPECAFIFGRDFLIFDHLYDRLHIVSVSYAYEQQPPEPMKRVDSLIQKLKATPPTLPPQEQQPYTIERATTREEYESMVREIKARIYRGDMLQCVPSQSMEVASTLPPLQAYRRLRHQNPSPYMFYYDFGEFVVLGASPEIMIRLKSVEERSFFTLRPIAGTRPRGENVARDLELESELLHDEKENAEHLMLLDLARNDAGKVSVGGGVSVLERNKIERYSRVMHIVSEVRGELDSKRFSKRDALKAAFPAGTLTGAPKIEAIRTIESLESHARGVYGGAIGYFARDEDMDFAIAIRTAVYQNGVYYLRSGAGVVYDSNPHTEYIETQNKVRSQLDMLGGSDDITHR